MNKYSEVEIKLDAEGLSPHDFIEFISKTSPNIELFKSLEGTDTFFKKEDDVVRHRCDGTFRESTLTVKKRKSKNSIVDRHEIDMPIKPSVPPEDVQAFLKLAGWKEEFRIFKKYYIFVVNGVYDSGNKPESYKACIALYDVWKTNKEKCRFLEVEIEKESNCTVESGKKILDWWAIELKKLLPEGKPLNKSLYEIFKGK